MPAWHANLHLIFEMIIGIKNAITNCVLEIIQNEASINNVNLSNICCQEPLRSQFLTPSIKQPGRRSINVTSDYWKRERILLAFEAYDDALLLLQKIAQLWGFSRSTREKISLFFSVFNYAKLILASHARSWDFFCMSCIYVHNDAFHSS